MPVWPSRRNVLILAFGAPDLQYGEGHHGWPRRCSCEPLVPWGFGLLGRPGPACFTAPIPPLFLAPSWNLSARLVPGVGFVPPVIAASSKAKSSYHLDVNESNRREFRDGNAATSCLARHLPRQTRQTCAGRGFSRAAIYALCYRHRRRTEPDPRLRVGFDMSARGRGSAEGEAPAHDQGGATRPSLVVAPG
jgi:hypothetical protein